MRISKILEYLYLDCFHRTGNPSQKSKTNTAFRVPETQTGECCISCYSQFNQKPAMTITNLALQISLCTVTSVFQKWAIQDRKIKCRLVVQTKCFYFERLWIQYTLINQSILLFYVVNYRNCYSKQIRNTWYGSEVVSENNHKKVRKNDRLLLITLHQLIYSFQLILL